MKLEMRSFELKDAFWGPATAFNNGVLTINVAELTGFLMRDQDQFESIDIALAKPGDKVRIIHILDAFEPRIKLNEEASAYPGFLSPPHRVGSGITCRLAGMAVLTCAEFPEYGPYSMMGANEGIIDMSGPGAVLSPFGEKINLTLTFKRKKESTTASFCNAVQMGGLKTAEYLAKALNGAKASAKIIYSLDADNLNPSLPKVGAVFLLSSLSMPLRESFVYGHPVSGMLPTLIHPNEMLDGAVVGNYLVYGGVRNCTYFYQNNPVLQELYKQHGKELNLVAVIVTRAGDTSNSGKLNQAATAAQLGELMGLNGIILSANAGGQQILDFMFTYKQFEKRGIRAVGMLTEIAGPEGTDIGGIVDFVPEADALVSMGNREALIDLPSMEEVVGGHALLDGKVWAGNQIKVPLRHIYASVTQVGAWNISAEAF